MQGGGREARGQRDEDKSGKHRHREARRTKEKSGRQKAWRGDCNDY
jgi:hypothetical protein